METVPAPAHAQVGCALTFDVVVDSLLLLQVAPSTTAGALAEERLEVLGPGGHPLPVVEREGAVGARLHLVQAPQGSLEITYGATLAVAAGPGAGPSVDADELDGIDADVIDALRPSRYCPSDALESFAPAELSGVTAGEGRGTAVAAWVFDRLRYEGGSSGPLTTAVDTLLAGAGVCRDFAHLTVALCRALAVPARLVSVYAPGLSPMDFHAVAEVHVEGRWEIVDATRLAPRASLVRIATGRDAADTAFAMTLHGNVQLLTTEITAVAAGELPGDDHLSPVVLA